MGPGAAAVDRRSSNVGSGTANQTPAPLPREFFGSVEVDADVATLDFSTIVNEVIQNFTAQTGVEVKITVEIQAHSREGFEAALQRAIKENCAVLKFRNAEFQ
jgi:aspartate aminotransferase-like enzyme